MQEAGGKEVHPVADGKHAPSPKRTATVECIQKKAQSLKRKQPSDSVYENHTAGYGSRQYPGDLVVSMEFKRNIGMPPALGDSIVESCRSFSVALAWLSFIPNEQQANLVFTVEEVSFSRDMVFVRKT